MAKNTPKNLNNLENKAFSGLFLAVQKLFSEIQERPRGILEARYGMKEKDPKTLEEIGKRYQITRERVRQIIKEIIKKTQEKRWRCGRECQR